MEIINDGKVVAENNYILENVVPKNKAFMANCGSKHILKYNLLLHIISSLKSNDDF